MGQIIDSETHAIQTPTIPIECAEGHQLYVVYFPQLDNYGFSCSVCHMLGVTCQDRKLVLEVVVSEGRPAKALSGDLLMYSEQRAERITCPKGHEIGAMSVGEHGKPIGFGFFDSHCKLYAMEIQHQDRVLVIQPRKMERERILIQ